MASAAEQASTARDYARAEILADGCVHIIGVVFSLLAASAMMVLAIHILPPLSTASLGVYAFGMVSVFACSAAYNLTASSRPMLKAMLRRFDHAAIYVKDCRHVHAVCGGQDGRRGGLALLERRVECHCLRRDREAALAGALGPERRTCCIWCKAGPSSPHSERSTRRFESRARC